MSEDKERQRKIEKMIRKILEAERDNLDNKKRDNEQMAKKIKSIIEDVETSPY